MRKLRKAAVVAAMVTSVGMVGAGTATAHNHDDAKKKESNSSRDLDIKNPQKLNCIYRDVTAIMPINMAVSVMGDANANQLLGNTCPQTGPSVEEEDD